MNNSDFRYPAEKFATARQILMLPHPDGDIEALAAAFNECSLGLERVFDDMLDDSARRWVSTINSTLDTDEVPEDPIKGTFYRKAESLSEDDIFKFSDAVDQLADWFHDKFHTD